MNPKFSIITTNFRKPKMLELCLSNIKDDLKNSGIEAQIIVSDSMTMPETASIMIENIETKKTYFFKTGEQLEGVTVKTIYTDRVVFSYENEETTIKL